MVLTDTKSISFFKYNKGGSGCPSGYTKNGNKCTKTETIKCKANQNIEWLKVNIVIGFNEK